MTKDEGMTKCRMSRLREGPAWQANVEGLINAEERMRARFLSSFVIRHSDFVIPAAAGHVCCCKPLMMLMSGVKSASTIVPTITARNTIIMGSSIDVRAATALSTSSS